MTKVTKYPPHKRILLSLAILFVVAFGIVWRPRYEEWRSETTNEAEAKITFTIGKSDLPLGLTWQRSWLYVYLAIGYYYRIEDDYPCNSLLVASSDTSIWIGQLQFYHPRRISFGSTYSPKCDPDNR